MTRLLWLMILLQAGQMQAIWEGDNLIVTAPPGRVYLVGGDRNDSYMGSGTIVMPAYGVDANRTPINRDALILKDTNGEVLSILPIPQKPPKTWIVILPIMVRSGGAP